MTIEARSYTPQTFRISFGRCRFILGLGGIEAGYDQDARCDWHYSRMPEDLRLLCEDADRQLAKFEDDIGYGPNWFREAYPGRDVLGIPWRAIFDLLVAHRDRAPAEFIELLDKAARESTSEPTT